jgi:hypothetical protein
VREVAHWLAVLRHKHLDVIPGRSLVCDAVGLAVCRPET